MAHLSFTIGALYRRQIRRNLIKYGYDFTEDKGFLDSFFKVTGDKDELIKLHNWLSKIKGD